MKEGWIMTNSTHSRISVAVFDYTARSNSLHCKRKQGNLFRQLRERYSEKGLSPEG